MALQIAPIKAPRRKILPNINAEHYEKAQKSRAKRSVGPKRSALVNPQLTKKIARQKTNRQMERQALGRDADIQADYKRGEALKKGIESLAKKADDVTDEQRTKLSKMDPSKLDEMYQANDLVFEVYFQYNQSSEGAKMLNDKNRDVDFLIKQYEQRFGTIEV